MIFVLAICVLLAPADAAAQIEGSVSIMYDTLPDLDPAPGRQDAHELRARLFAQRSDDIQDAIRVVIGAWVDGLVASRALSVGTPSGHSSGGDATTDAILRPADIYLEISGERADLRIGASRVVWGRLDEFLPTDVVNPIDLTRFLLEGRSEARLPVGLVRGRVFLPRSSTLEGILVPVFRASSFDQLDERSSPFNPVNAGLPVERFEPPATFGNVQGGARFTSTVGRVDWAVTAYRGFRSFPIVTGVPVGSALVLHETFPRFTMVGGDFETVRGAWGLRGEGAVFDEGHGESFEGGLGIDRRAGHYRIAGDVLWSDDAGTTFVAVVDRSFARETRTLRVFTALDPGDQTTFARAIAALLLRENTWLEGSAGLFAGSSSDTLGRLTHRDFAYLRLKVFF
jgi:hypothetical protein